MRINGKQKYIYLLAMTLIIILLTGCTKTNQLKQNISEQNSLKENIVNNESKTDKGLIIKSENPIYSKTEVLEELNKELESLLQTLDSMDNIDDEDLDF